MYHPPRSPASCTTMESPAKEISCETSAPATTCVPSLPSPPVPRSVDELRQLGQMLPRFRQELLLPEDMHVSHRQVLRNMRRTRSGCKPVVAWTPYQREHTFWASGGMRPPRRGGFVREPYFYSYVYDTMAQSNVLECERCGNEFGQPADLFSPECSVCKAFRTARPAVSQSVVVEMRRAPFMPWRDGWGDASPPRATTLKKTWEERGLSLSRRSSSCALRYSTM